MVSINNKIKFNYLFLIASLVCGAFLDIKPAAKITVEEGTEIGSVSIAMRNDINDLHSSIKTLDLTKIKKLIDKKIDINFQNSDGETPLVMAINNISSNIKNCLRLKRGQPTDNLISGLNSIESIIEMLLENGADVNKKNNNGVSGLISLVKFKEDMRVLIMNALGLIDLNARLPYEGLISQLINNLVKKILSKNANVDDVDSDGTTALMNAVENKDTDLINILLDRGASLDIRDARGKTALDIINGQLESNQKLAIEMEGQPLNWDSGERSSQKEYIKKLLDIVNILKENESYRPQAIKMLKDTIYNKLSDNLLSLPKVLLILISDYFSSYNYKDFIDFMNL